MKNNKKEGVINMTYETLKLTIETLKETATKRKEKYGDYAIDDINDILNVVDTMLHTYSDDISFEQFTMLQVIFEKIEELR